MAFTGKLYGNFMKRALNKEIDWVNGTVKCMLCTEAYVPNLGADQYLDSVTGEVNGTNYPVGGFTLTGKSVTYDHATGITAVKADDITVINLTANNFRYAVIYVDSGSTSTSPLIGLIDFGEVKGITGGILNLVWDVAGVFQHTYQG